LSEGFDRVEGLAGLQAVMQLAEHLVEQVSQGGGVAVVFDPAVGPLTPPPRGQQDRIRRKRIRRFTSSSLI
jgi:hypothetical protein